MPRVPVVDTCKLLIFDQYGHEQGKIKKKRWNNNEIKKFHWK